MPQNHFRMPQGRFLVLQMPYSLPVHFPPFVCQNMEDLRFTSTDAFHRFQPMAFIACRADRFGSSIFVLPRCSVAMYASASNLVLDYFTVSIMFIAVS